MFIGNSKDIICILENKNTGKYHSAVYSKSNASNGDVCNIATFELRNFHTNGFSSIVECNKDIDRLRIDMRLSIKNIFRNPVKWDSELPITMNVTVDGEIE